jgi:flagellar basal-body rod modification protein FlgD
MNLFSVLDQQTLIPTTQTANDGKSASELAREEAEQEKVDFLNLLLTQLSNQNPLDPMDTDEWTAQLTRYSILEQGIETNSQLSITNDLLKTNATTSSFSYIGKEVEIPTNINAVQDGSATWMYVVEGDASDVKLTITDNVGRRIIEVDGSISKGVQTFEFDATQFGIDDGTPLYLSINATDGDDAKLNSETTIAVNVDGVWSDGSDQYLTAGEISFRTGDVLKIIDQQTADASATTQTTN